MGLTSFFFNEDFSFDVSVDYLLETTGNFRIKNLEVCLQFGLGDRIEYDVFRSATDFADPISLIHTIASIGRLVDEDTLLPETHTPDPQVSEFKPGFGLKFSSFHFLGTCVSLSPPVLAPPLEHEKLAWMSVYLQDSSNFRTGEMDKQAATLCAKRSRLHSLNQSGLSVPTLPPPV